MSSPATPKQIAFLIYMKVDGAENFTRDQAERAFEFLDPPRSNLGHQNDLTGEWEKDRGILFPQIYPKERKVALTRKARAIVSYRVKGSSGKLTQSKLDALFSELDATDIYWPIRAEANENFYKFLQIRNPECCDGTPVSREPKNGAKVQNGNHSVKSKGKAGCLAVVAGIGAGATVFSQWWNFL